MNKITIAISVATLLMYGCSDKPKDQESGVKTEKTQSVDKTAEGVASQNIYGASAEQPAETDIQLNAPHIGNVLETMDGGGYTYVKVDQDGNAYWIAGPKSNVTVGASISYIEQMIMSDFTSKALNKKFDTLMFVSAIVPANQAAQLAASKGEKCEDCDHDKELKMDSSAAMPAHPVPVVATPTAPIKIAKNTKGYSVEELYAKKDSLKDRNVKLNAQVVKVSKGIMGKDWIHLQDGSGSAGTDDIIATSVNSTVKVGDTVTTDGVVKTNIDLGYGYKFPIIIEKAKFTSIK
ncbi:MAG: hypothetical protein L3J19_02390 [Sulfurimonas sp.]|nr:hypothetical protein [Sulfurimonas sp.]